VRCRCRPVARRAQAVEHVRDPEGHLRAPASVFGMGWALVRPDGYLAATGAAIDGRLVAALERSLGLR
jgi:3-(3-hydroxy-phenyl)propionate hydroxylase